MQDFRISTASKQNTKKITSRSSMLHTISNRQVDNSHHCHPQLVVNLSTEVVVLLAWYQPAGLHCRMLSALHHLDQVQSLCSPCCADKSEHSSHHNSISLLHSHLLLPFLPSTQRQPHSSQTQHQPPSPTTSILFHINTKETNLQPSTTQ